MKVEARGMVTIWSRKGGVETMAMPQKDDTIETLKKPSRWSAEAWGEGGYEVVPPEKDEEFRKMAEEENRRRRPGMYA